MPSICSMLERKIPSIHAGIDQGELAERDFETFELYFLLNENCGLEIDPETTDGSLTIYQLAQSAANLIVERYAEEYKEMYPGIGAIGISIYTNWQFGHKNVPALEAMIGTPQNEKSIPACWKFYVRFAPLINQIEGKCLSSPPREPEDEEDSPYYFTD